MGVVSLEESFEKTKYALAALQAAIQKPMDPDYSTIDTALRRFEITGDLILLLLHQLLKTRGIHTSYDRDALQEAERGGLIDQIPLWWQMFQDHHLSSHVTKGQEADAIFSRITATYYPLMEKTFNNLYANYAK